MIGSSAATLFGKARPLKQALIIAGAIKAPREIIDLVQRFDRNMQAYHSGQYNEAQVRQEFIDPFFKALSWDLDNTAGYAEAYKDVIQRQIDVTDRQIDRLVYELYELTDQEVRILEGVR